MHFLINWNWINRNPTFNHPPLFLLPNLNIDWDITLADLLPTQDRCEGGYRSEELLLVSVLFFDCGTI